MSRRGFTLVEMLVVIGIIGILAALLLPAVMAAVGSARRAAIGVDIADLDKAFESYREKTGDYPPNFRDYNAFIRHVNKCYGKIDPTHLNTVIGAVWQGGPPYSTSNPPPVTVVPMIDEGESLVFWLYLVDNDKRQPFKAIIVGFGLDPTIPSPTLADVINAAKSPERIYPLAEARLIDGTSDLDVMPAYKASYSGESAYLYLDSRSYMALTGDYTNPLTAAYADDLAGAGYVRPYWTLDRANSQPITGTDMRPFFKPVNPGKFQIIGAGQDGLFGADGVDPSNPSQPSLRYFPGGAGYNTSLEDYDNLTNFSEGKRLEDHLP